MTVSAVKFVCANTNLLTYLLTDKCSDCISSALAEVNIFHYNIVPVEVTTSQKYDMYSTIAIKQYKKVTSDLLRGQGYFIVSAVVLIIDVLSFSFFLIQGGTRSLCTPVLRPK